MNKDEALKMAINEIQDLMKHIKDRQPDMLFTGSEYVINTCKEALEQPAQEPVAFIDINWVINYTEHGVDNCYDPVFNPNGKLNVGDKLYTHPHQVVPTSTWQGLTDDDISTVVDNMRKDNHGNLFSNFDFARVIEQALKEKNSV